MKRPYTVCHILSALDGKITGAFMGTDAVEAAGAAYSSIRGEYQAEAWLYGTVTTKEFTGGRKPQMPQTTIVPSGDFAAPHSETLYYVSVDTQGEIGWESGTFRKAGRPDAHVIEVLTEQTPLAYRNYLRAHGVSYILAGTDKLDACAASEKLYRLFDIRTMLICGGGTINWTFLQQGAVDELSLLLAPAADGDPNAVTVFERSPLLPPSAPVTFQLKKVEELGDSVVRLVYTANNRMENEA